MHMLLREACDFYMYFGCADLKLQFHFDLRTHSEAGFCAFTAYKVPFLDWHGWHPTLCQHHFLHVGLSLDLKLRDAETQTYRDMT